MRPERARTYLIWVPKSEISLLSCRVNGWLIRAVESLSRRFNLARPFFCDDPLIHGGDRRRLPHGLTVRVQITMTGGRNLEWSCRCVLLVVVVVLGGGGGHSSG